MLPRFSAGAVALAMMVTAVPARGSDGPRAYRGPTDVQGQVPESKPVRKRPKAKRAPPPRIAARTISVAVGLSPEAPGSKAEKTLLSRLERSSVTSKDPPTHVRRLRPGAGDARLVCRERRDDLVVLIGYVPDRDRPVVLPFDCGLDRALGMRAVDAIDEPGLVRALWREREQLVRQGFRERRRVGRLGPKARAGIIAGVALVVIGAAIGILVAGALRKETVVLKVEP